MTFFSTVTRSATSNDIDGSIWEGGNPGPASVQIPAEGDWTDHGTILSEGRGPNEVDHMEGSDVTTNYAIDKTSRVRYASNVVKKGSQSLEIDHDQNNVHMTSTSGLPNYPTKGGAPYRIWFRTSDWPNVAFTIAWQVQTEVAGDSDNHYQYNVGGRTANNDGWQYSVSDGGTLEDITTGYISGQWTDYNGEWLQLVVRHATADVNETYGSTDAMEVTVKDSALNTIVQTAARVEDSSPYEGTFTGGGVGYFLFPADDQTSTQLYIDHANTSDWDSNFDQVAPWVVQDGSGAYYMLYSAANGARDSDGGPRHRSMGLATAPAKSDITDPSNWTKYHDNPILERVPNGVEEEGFDKNCTFWENGTAHMYVGEIVDAGSNAVHTNIAHYTSTDLRDWTRQGQVIAFDDPPYGDQDEIFMAGAVRKNGTYFLFVNVLESGDGGIETIVAASSTKDFASPTWTEFHESASAESSKPSFVERGTADDDWLELHVAGSTDTEFYTPDFGTPTVSGSRDTVYSGTTYRQPKLVRDGANWYLLTYDADPATAIDIRSASV